MILNKQLQESDLTYESYNLEEKKFETTIDKSDSYLIMDLVSNFYRNPIGSIIREITSNCFDAHKKANNIEDAVVIKIGYDFENSNYYIEFIDKGTGLSEEQVQNIYAIWFKSDKRESNDFIGGFGLGSKSPFSYTDIYYINTNFDGITYEYVNFKKDYNNKGIREFDFSQINKYPTIEPNGTIIKIDLKNNNDLPKFCYEIRNQLSYFYNVFLDLKSPMFSDYTYNLKQFNDEKILEYKTFSYRCSKNNNLNTNNNIFILLGTVKYEININEMPELQCILPFGIKFNIGDLTVVPNREDIHYSEYNKKVIRDKFELFKQEINELVLSQNELSFSDYLAYKKSINLSLKIGNDEYNRIFNNSVFNNISILQDVKKVFLPLEEYNYRDINIDVLNTFYDSNYFTKYIGERKVIIINNNYSLVNQYFNQGVDTIRKNHKSDLRYTIPRSFERYIGYCYKKGIRKNNNECYRRDDLGLDNFLTDNIHDYKTYEVTLKNGDTLIVKSRIVPELGKAIKLYKMIKYFKDLINVVYSDSLVITDEMRVQYKEHLDSNNLALMRKRNKQIIIHEYYFGSAFFSKRIVSVGNLEKYKFVIYKIKDVRNKNNDNIFINGKLINITYINEIVQYANKEINNKKVNFIYFEISKSELDKLKKENLENMISIEEFMFTDFVKKNVFKSIIKYDLKNKYNLNLNMYDNKLLFNLSNYYSKNFDNIIKYLINITDFQDLHSLYNKDKLKESYSCLLNDKLLFYYKTLSEIELIYTNNPLLKYLNNYTPNNLVLPLMKKVKHLKYPESHYVQELKNKSIKNNKEKLIYLV